MRSLANSEPNPALREQLETVANDYDEIAYEIEQEIETPRWREEIGAEPHHRCRPARNTRRVRARPAHPHQRVAGPRPIRALIPANGDPVPRQVLAAPALM
jgi:hypothetical protein